MLREGSHAVGNRAHDYNTNCKHLDVLLILKVTIQRNEDLANLACTPQKLAVLDAGPAQTVNC